MLKRYKKFYGRLTWLVERIPWSIAYLYLKKTSRFYVEIQEVVKLHVHVITESLYFFLLLQVIFTVLSKTLRKTKHLEL